MPKAKKAVLASVKGQSKAQPGQIAQEITGCNMPDGCLVGERMPEERHERPPGAVQVQCSREDCPFVPYMHAVCYERWEDSLILCFTQRQGKTRKCSYEDAKKDLWNRSIYDTLFRFVKCPCSGMLKRDYQYEKMQQGKREHELREKEAAAAAVHRPATQCVEMLRKTMPLQTATLTKNLRQMQLQRYKDNQVTGVEEDEEEGWSRVPAKKSSLTNVPMIKGSLRPLKAKNKSVRSEQPCGTGDGLSVFTAPALDTNPQSTACSWAKVAVNPAPVKDQLVAVSHSHSDQHIVCKQRDVEPVAVPVRASRSSTGTETECNMQQPTTATHKHTEIHNKHKTVSGVGWVIRMASDGRQQKGLIRSDLPFVCAFDSPNHTSLHCPTLALHDQVQFTARVLNSQGTFSDGSQLGYMALSLHAHKSAPSPTPSPSSASAVPFVSGPGSVGSNTLSSTSPSPFCAAQTQPAFIESVPAVSGQTAAAHTPIGTERRQSMHNINTMQPPTLPFTEQVPVLHTAVSPSAPVTQPAASALPGLFPARSTLTPGKLGLGRGKRRIP